MMLKCKKKKLFHQVWEQQSNHHDDGRCMDNWAATEDGDSNIKLLPLSSRWNGKNSLVGIKSTNKYNNGSASWRQIRWSNSSDFTIRIDGLVN